MFGKCMWCVCVCVSIKVGIDIQPTHSLTLLPSWVHLFTIFLFPKHNELQFHFECYSLCVSVVSRVVLERGVINRGQFVNTIINCAHQQEATVVTLTLNILISICCLPAKGQQP